MNELQRIEIVPIGIGLGSIEAEIDACLVWNKLIDSGLLADSFLLVSDMPKDFFVIYGKKSMEQCGIIVFSEDRNMFRLTATSIEKLRQSSIENSSKKD